MAMFRYNIMCNRVKLLGFIISNYMVCLFLDPYYGGEVRQESDQDDRYHRQRIVAPEGTITRDRYGLPVVSSKF